MHSGEVLKALEEDVEYFPVKASLCLDTLRFCKRFIWAVLTFSYRESALESELNLNINEYVFLKDAIAMSGCHR